MSDTGVSLGRLATISDAVDLFESKAAGSAEYLGPMNYLK